MISARLIRGLIKRIFGLKDSFTSTSEIEVYHTAKLRHKLKGALRTPYWRMVITDICKERGMTTNEFITSIRSTRDFVRMMPTTSRSVLDLHGKEMLTRDAAKLTEAHTSGTTTSKPISVFFSLLDIARMATSLVRNYEHMGVGQGGHLVGLIPSGSSLAQADGKIEVIMPNVRFVHFDKITGDDVRKILAADSLYSYANIPIQMLTRFKDVVDECKRAGTVRLRSIITTGDFLAEGTATKIKDILGNHIRIYCPYNSIESLMSTYCCTRGNIHVSSGYYFPEVAEDNSELLMTPLYCESMHYFRYRSGDIVEKVACDCGNPDLAFKIVGRSNANELHKNLRVDTIQNIVFSSEPFKSGKIDGESGVISTKLTSDGRVVDVYVKQGREYKTSEEDEIKRQLEESIVQSNEYAFKLLSTSSLKNWQVSFHVVENLPSPVQPGKWKVQTL